MTELLAVRGLEKTSAAFRRELVDVALRLGIAWDFLSAVMSFETGGTFDPAIRNPTSGATGLIQFMPSTAKALGTSTAELAQMSDVEQLAVVERYYEPVADRLLELSDVYLAVFAPIGIGRPPDFVLYAAPSAAYEQNKALDHGGDGTITVADATAPVAGLLHEAESRPRLTDAGAAAPTDRRVGVAGVALLGLVVFVAWKVFS